MTVCGKKYLLDRVTVQLTQQNVFHASDGPQTGDSVTIPLTLNDSSEASFSKDSVVTTGSITITADNWNQPQNNVVTVYGVDDDIADGDQTYVLQTGALSSNSPEYDELDADAVADITLTNTDLDVAGFTITPQALTIAENGGTGTIAIRPNTQPTGTVIFDVTAVLSRDISVSPAQLTFNATNWQTAQNVTVTGIDDKIDRNDTASARFSINAATTSAEYQELAPKAANVTLTDDDQAGISVTPASQNINEAARGQLNVVLTSQPTSNVVVNLASSDTSAVSLNPSSLTFTPANWNVPQTVTLDGVEDADAVNDLATITMTIDDANSAAEYRNVADVTSSVTVIDDDLANIIVNQTALTVGENGGTASFGTRLSAQPTSNVVVNIVAPSGLAASATTLTFTPTNWNQFQTITVTGVNNNVQDGNRTLPVTMVINQGQSADEYDAAANKTVNVTILDDDKAGFTVMPTDLGTINETATKTFTVRLTSQPQADVVIDISSSIPGSVGVTPTILRFTSVNWNQTQQVTVKALDDDNVVNENATMTLAIDDANSTPEYRDIADQTVKAATADNDTAAITLTPTELTMNETVAQAPLQRYCRHSRKAMW